MRGRCAHVWKMHTHAHAHSFHTLARLPALFQTLDHNPDTLSETYTLNLPNSVISKFVLTRTLDCASNTCLDPNLYLFAISKRERPAHLPPFLANSRECPPSSTLTLPNGWKKVMRCSLSLWTRKGLWTGGRMSSRPCDSLQFRQSTLGERSQPQLLVGEADIWYEEDVEERETERGPASGISSPFRTRKRLCTTESSRFCASATEGYTCEPRVK